MVATVVCEITGETYLWDNPSTLANQKRTLEKGEIVTVYAFDDNWTFVEYGSETGFVLRRDVKVAS